MHAKRDRNTRAETEWLDRLLRELPPLGRDGFYGSGL
jgi:hypothetical protein